MRIKDSLDVGIDPRLKFDRANPQEIEDRLPESDTYKVNTDGNIKSELPSLLIEKMREKGVKACGKSDLYTRETVPVNIEDGESAATALAQVSESLDRYHINKYRIGRGLGEGNTLEEAMEQSSSESLRFYGLLDSNTPENSVVLNQGLYRVGFFDGELAYKLNPTYEVSIDKGDLKDELKEEKINQFGREVANDLDDAFSEYVADRKQV